MVVYIYIYIYIKTYQHVILLYILDLTSSLLLGEQ